MIGKKEIYIGLKMKDMIASYGYWMRRKLNMR